MGSIAGEAAVMTLSVAETIMPKETLYLPVQKELSAVETLLEKTVREQSGFEYILELGGYSLNAKGKRLRPSLLLLCAQAVNPVSHEKDSQGRIPIAAAVELIHIASLIHDDVIDQSPMRHRRETVHSKWGNETAIALGDYLYSVALNILTPYAGSDILRCISTTVKEMSEGELIQIVERNNLTLAKDRYLKIIEKKTAALFAASCELAALLAPDTKKFAPTLRSYGYNLGMAYQIIDDYQDLAGDAEITGKAPGLDLKSGELTLPLLNLLLVSPDKNNILRLIAQHGDESSYSQLRQYFISSTALTKTRAEAVSYMAKARASIEGINDSIYRQSLVDFTNRLIEKMQ